MAVSRTRSVAAAFGSWPSPITSRRVAEAQIQLVDVLTDGDDIYWVEGRPREEGRQVLVRRHADGSMVDVTPRGMSARTRVHEYGGAGVVVSGGVVCFSGFDDQRLYRLDESGRAVPLTPAPTADRPAMLRYADGQLDAGRKRWIGIREDHRNPQAEAVNSIVAVDLLSGGAGVVLVQGGDFYSSVRLDSGGDSIAWLTWNHPNMPWTGTELWIGRFTGDAVVGATRVAGGSTESIFQPEWSPDGRLHFVSDRSGWWNLYRVELEGTITPLCPMEGEFGRAQWTFGMSTYAFLSARRIVCSYVERGKGAVALLDVDRGVLAPFDLPFSDFASLRVSNGRVVFKAGAPTIAPSVVVMDPDSGNTTAIRSSSTVAEDPAIGKHLSVPELLRFPTRRGREAFALFYPPHHADRVGPAGQLPPLLVRCHGGPTSSASRSLDLRTQFWTSRGIAVVDVDYGGSTGYGRAYRDRLHGMWGIVDAEDCAAAVAHLVARGQVDPARTVIAGGSSGGFTALTCMTSADESVRALFKAGASYYGVSDLETLARDTHKFESRYLDWLIAPVAGMRGDAAQEQRGNPYRDRSPMYNAARLEVPVAFFQGSEDKIVPPSQTEQMVAALRQRGMTAQYLLFAGEQHGFRLAKHIQWSLDAEFYFYSALAFNASA